jgi:hypothetical protein
LKELRVAPKKTSLKLLNVIVLPSSILLRELFTLLSPMFFAEAEHRPKFYLEVTSDLYPSE